MIMAFALFFEFQSCPEKNLATSASKSSDAAEEREGAGTGGDAIASRAH